MAVDAEPAAVAAPIAYAKSMSIDSYGDTDPTVYSEYLWENLPGVQRQERGRRSAGRPLYIARMQASVTATIKAPRTPIEVPVLGSREEA